MVYKRYIKRKVNGELKTFGPYYYENSRDKNGKVKSKYLGTDLKKAKKLKKQQKVEKQKIKKKKIKKEIKKSAKKKKKKPKSSEEIVILVGVWILMIATLVNFAFLINLGLTGKASLLADTIPSAGELITGSVRLTLSYGELIPYDTNIIINNSGVLHSYLLGDLLSEIPVQGEFYMNGKNLVGNGSGFGEKGELEVYPNVSFIMGVSSLGKPGKGGAIPVERVVNGNTSYGSPYNYVLKRGETARLISSEHPVVFFKDIEIGEIVISTDYSEIELGYGEEYTNPLEVEYSFFLNPLNLLASPGEFSITYEYGGEVLVYDSIIIEAPPVGDPMVVENITHYNVTLNNPVKWNKNLKLDRVGEIKVNIPIEAVNIGVLKQGNPAIYSVVDQANSKEITINDDSLEYDLEYDTNPPVVAEEEVIERGKRIKITGADDPNVHYENVLVSTTLDETLNIRDPSTIKLYWVEQDSYLTPENVQDTNGNSVYDYVEWIVPQLSNQTFEITISILNVQSYPIVGGNWTVAFNTTGTANLSILAVNGTTWSDTMENEDLKFLEILCGNQLQTYSWINDGVFIENYTCVETSYEVSKVLTSGKHHLEFNFGGQIEQAHNDAGDYEVGVVSGVNGWTTVNLFRTYINPVVVVTGQQGADISMDVEASRPIIRNVQSTSFEVVVMNDAGTIVTENVGYIVMEEGHFSIDGVEVEAGFYTVSNANTQTVTFGQAFPGNTVVVDAIQEDTGKVMTSRYNENSMTSTSYSVMWEDFNLNNQFSPGTAIAGYIAVELGALNSLFESGIYDECTADPGDGLWCTINFANNYFSIPILFANPVEAGGGDPTVMGRQVLTTTSVDLRPTEDRVTDTEQGHANNDLPYLIWRSAPLNDIPTDPTNIECNGGTNCDITIGDSVALEGLGSTDAESDPITYYLEAKLNTPTNSGDQEPGTQQLIASGGGMTFGESGEVIISDGNNYVITFQNTYVSTPVVIAIPVTENAGDNNAIIPVISGITTNQFNLKLCVDAGLSTCSIPTSAETINYFVFDVDVAQNYNWIEVGTLPVTTSGADTLLTFSQIFSNVPYVFATIQTDTDGGSTMAPTIWTDTATTSNVQLLGCAHPGILNSCTSVGTEIAGYVAIDPVLAEIDGIQLGSQDIGNSAWTGVIFSPSFVDPTIMVTQNDDDGGQDPQYPWARFLTQMGADIRYCEQDGAGDCDTHTGEFVRWFALEKGDITLGGGASDNEAVTGWKTYTDIFSSDRSTLLSLEVEIISSVYSSLGSAQNGNNMPDLELEIWDGIAWVSLGIFGVDTVGTFSIITIDPTILSAWEIASNTHLRVRGTNFDYFDALNFDQIDYVDISVLINGKEWTPIGNHADGSSFVWDTSLIPNQQNINIRTRAIDETGGNIYSNYFTKNPISPYLEILHGFNSPPSIDYVEPILDQSPSDGGATTVVFEVQVSDPEGYGDITSVDASFSKTGETTRSGTCNFVTDIDLDTASYSCSIDMQYYDAAGIDWLVTITAQDSDSNIDIHNSNNFVYLQLKSMQKNLPVGTLSWPSLASGQIEVLATNYNEIENFGNYEGPILITARNLLGADLVTEFNANNFWAGINTGGAECSAFQLQDAVQVSIADSLLTRGTGAVEDIYYCISNVPSLISQSYSTTNSGNPWVIAI